MAMSLESMLHKVAKPFVIAGASAYLILNVLGCNGNATQTPNPTQNPSPKPSPTQTYEPEPTATLEPYTPTPTKEPTPTITPPPTLEAKIFDFIFTSGTPEQYEATRKNALEDYRAVLKVYGIKEGGGRVKFIVDQQGYSVNFFLGNKFGGAVGGLDDLLNPLYRQRGTKHEMAHAINHTLFKTKLMLERSTIDTEPWYNTFDEGSAMYASGEVTSITSLINDERWGSVLKERLNGLRTNPEIYWKNREVGNPGHATGSDLFTILVLDYGLTP